MENTTNKVSAKLDDRWKSVANEALPLKSHVFDAERCSLSVLDQRFLPLRMEYVQVQSMQDGFDAIKEMKVRGAPLIATVGMLSLLVDLHSTTEGSVTLVEFIAQLEQKCVYLLSARPTAINLANAIGELRKHIQNIKDEKGMNIPNLKQRIKQFVLDWQANERNENDALLRNAVTCILEYGKRQKLVVMTICNTGQLATSSFGTALGAILMLHRHGRLELAIALETRPYNQGSRLTAVELQQGGIPFRLIVDSAATSAMRHFGVDVVLVGADQVALNGDTANKIGTYSLAVLAHHHRIPFFVVTPIASVNARLADGSGIRVEERPAAELTQWNGMANTPSDCPVWNPAFDVTPAELITRIITEQGNFAPEQLGQHFGKN